MFESIDVETHLAKRAQAAPRIVCGVVGSEDGSAKIHMRDAITAQWLRMCRDPNITIVNEYIPYDIACLLEQECDRGPFIEGTYGRVSEFNRASFDKLAAGQVIGIDICQQLLDVAEGEGLITWREKMGYSQVNVARWNGLDVPDKEETWRMYFSQLDGIAPELWPEDPREYLLGDGTTPLQVLRIQLARNQQWIDSYGHPVLHQAPTNTWSQVSLHLAASHGVRAHPGRTHRLDTRVRKHVDDLSAELLAPTDGTPPLLRWQKKKGVMELVRNTKIAQARMEAACAAQGRVAARTDPSDKFPAGQVQLDEDACILSADPLLLVYSEYGTSDNLLGRVEDLKEGAQGLPLNTSFTTVRATGRTSSRKPKPPHKGTQQQNWPRGTVEWWIRQPDGTKKKKKFNIGARECLEPREGCSFLWADFEAAEMHTLAQNCRDEVGYSRLGELLNNGIDPHAYFAGIARLGLSGMSDKEIAATVMARPDKKDFRDWAKPCNFGRPGGMGDEKFVLFSRKSYGVEFSIQEAGHYGRIWFDCYPEVKDLHKVVKKLLGRNQTCTVRIKRGGFVAGGKHFTAACNFFFQAPCAAGAKSALNWVCYECYADPNSPLFGFRIWNMVHDELCLEGPTERLHDAGVRLREIMEREFNFYTPDYPTGVEVIAGNAWSKNAKPCFVNAAGESCKQNDPGARLTPWIYEEKEAA